mgnify:CR=1 FL=1
MHPGDSHESGIPHRAAGVVLCTALALLFWAGADRLIGIDRGYFDLFQRFTAGPAEAQVIIVDTGTTEPNPDLAWEMVKRAVERGVMLFAPVGVGGCAIKINPPLVISEETALEGLALLEESLAAVLPRHGLD